MQQLLHAALEHLGSALSTAFASLPTAAAAAGGMGSPGPSGTGGCPVEALGQYFMDLVYLDATLSKAGDGDRERGEGDQGVRCQTLAGWV